MNAARRKIGRIAAATAVLAVLGALVYGLLQGEAAAVVSYALDEETHPWLFIGMYAVLPMIGFPISAFLVLLGLKFGSWLGVLIMFGGIPLHLYAARFVSQSFLREWLHRLFRKMDYRMPQIPEHRQAWFGFVFMAVPGLSYTLKNYILALSGISPRIFFLSGFLVQGAMGVPLVIAGDAAAGKSLVLLAAVLVLLLLVYGIFYRIRKRHRLHVSKHGSMRYHRRDHRHSENPGP